MLSTLFLIYAIYLLITNTGRFVVIALALLCLWFLYCRVRYGRRKPSLIARWREESRRMAEAEADGEAFCDEDDDEPEDLFCDGSDDEDPAFCGLDREKEIKRLERVLEGMYTRRDRMLYTYGCMDRGATDEDWAKLEKTKAWRGLQFDIKYTEKRIEMLKGE